MGTRPPLWLSLVLRTHADVWGRRLRSSWHNSSFQRRPGSAHLPCATQGKHPLLARFGWRTQGIGSKRWEKREDGPVPFHSLLAWPRGPWQCPRRGQTPCSPAPRIRSARMGLHQAPEEELTGQDAAGPQVHGERGRLLCSFKPGSQEGTSLSPSVAHVPREVWQGASPGCFPAPLGQRGEAGRGGRSPTNHTLGI